MITNDVLRDAEFKDESPLKTVEHVKSILAENGIETEEFWFESGVPYCYSLRVMVNGTNFGVNGKGMSKEFAFASAYGELMERLQIGAIAVSDNKKSKDKQKLAKIVKSINYNELLSLNKKWYEDYSELLFKATGEKHSPEAILKQFADENDEVKASPFFRVNTRSIEYHPTGLRNLIYTSNGSAAGNTPEEAIVQGISEIVERRHKIRILTENIAVPEIPDEELKKYTAAYNVITYLRNKGFHVIVKDCSLGTKYPVVCVSCIDKSTGRYHDHFGAYPIFEIALERALTESFQGRNIDNFTVIDDFIYDKSGVFPNEELSYENAMGVSRKNPNFFIGDSGDGWNKNCGFVGKNNKELFKECIEFFEKQGFDVLIRDLSCLGFPTYQIIIPGYSETRLYRLAPSNNELKCSNIAVDMFRNPSAASMSDILAVIMHLNQNKKFNKLMRNNLFSSVAQVPLKATSKQENKQYIATLAYVFYVLGKFNETIMYIQQLLQFCEKAEQEYLICLKRYLSFKLHNHEESQIKKLLELFHTQETINEIFSCTKQKRNPLERFILHCGEVCDENCPLKQYCCLERTNQITTMIKEKIDAMDFDSSVQKLLNLL